MSLNFIPEVAGPKYLTSVDIAFKSSLGKIDLLKILFSNNIDVNSLDIIDKYIHDNSFIPSQLYENLKNEPFMEEEEALEIYKPMVYSKEASYINSINLNEC